MKIIMVVALVFLSGCRTLAEGFNDVMYEMGGYGNEAPMLASSPTPSSCSDRRCRTLDAVESRGYQLARQKKITWVAFVDGFYKKRAELFPKTDDRLGAREMMLYQRALAEQMDSGKITESQWAYLIEKKQAEIDGRGSATTGYQSQPSQSGSIGGGVTCHKKREWSSGFNKNCVYDCLGSDAVQTIGATQLCPLTITR